MKNTLLLGLIAFAAADVLVVEDRRHWETIAEDFQPEDLAFVLYHTPWCTHCRRAEPEFEIASNHIQEWPRAYVNRTILATFDCDKNRSACGRLGFYQYPMITLTGQKQQTVQEYPDFPRRAENLLSWLAFKRRKMDYFPAASKEEFDRNMDMFLKSCKKEFLGTETDYSFAASLCRSLVSRKYILGSKEALDAANTEEPKVPTVIVEFEVPKELISTYLPSSQHICLVDQYGKDSPQCLNVVESQSELRDLVKDNKYVSFVEDGNWQTFFEYKERKPSKKILVAAVGKVHGDIAAMMKEVLKDIDFYGMTWDFERERVEPLFGQLDVRVEGTHPVLVVFNPTFADRGYFEYPQTEPVTRENVRQWLSSIVNKSIKAKYPLGLEPGFFHAVKREILNTVKVFKNAKKNMPWGAYVKLAAGLVGAMISVAGLYWLTADKNDQHIDRLSKRMPPLIHRRKAPKKDEEAKKDSKPTDDDKAEKEKPEESTSTKAKETSVTETTAKARTKA